MRLDLTKLTRHGRPGMRIEMWHPESDPRPELTRLDPFVTYMGVNAYPQLLFYFLFIPSIFQFNNFDNIVLHLHVGPIKAIWVVSD